MRYFTLMKKRLFLSLPLLFISPLWAAEKTTLIKEQKGFFVCSGGGAQAPLFSKECDVLTLTRIDATYEATCTDSNGILYSLGCQSFTFEHGSKPKVDVKSYWDQTKGQ